MFCYFFYDMTCILVSQAMNFKLRLLPFLHSWALFILGSQIQLIRKLVIKTVQCYCLVMGDITSCYFSLILAYFIQYSTTCILIGIKNAI